jgi:CotH kinase protein
MKKRPTIFINTAICLIAVAPLSAQTLNSSNLPIIMVETNGQTINFSKVLASFKIIDNPAGQLNHPTDPPSYEGQISIRLRGNYSAGLPQKPYTFETLDEATGLDTSVALLGMPKEEDWILLATWNDKSFVRNALMFNLARAAGQWAPNTRHVELLLNGQYNGIYVFCEKIKRDGDRVNVEKLTPEQNTLPELSGGYIFRHDYGWDFGTDNWQPVNCPDRSLNFEMVYPKIEDITPAQLTYVKYYMDVMEATLFSSNFADSLTGYHQYLDMDSWVDYFILSELSGNVDAYKKSMFYHKERNGLLKMGPIWDFDWALKFLGENSFPNGAGWLYKVDPCTQDVLYVPFRKKVCERWQFLRANQMHNDQIFGYIDSTALALDEAQARHFERWQCLGFDSGAPELPPYPTTYAGEVDKLKQFLQQRIAWMDTNLPNIACQPTGVPPTHLGLSVEVLPNVGTGNFTIKVVNLPAAGLAANLFNAVGQHCAQFQLANGDNPLDLTAYPVGAYFLQVNNRGERMLRRMVVAR